MNCSKANKPHILSPRKEYIMDEKIVIELEPMCETCANNNHDGTVEIYFACLCCKVNRMDKGIQI